MLLSFDLSDARVNAVQTSLLAAFPAPMNRIITVLRRVTSPVSPQRHQRRQAIRRARDDLQAGTPKESTSDQTSRPVQIQHIEGHAIHQIEHAQRIQKPSPNPSSIGRSDARRKEAQVLETVRVRALGSSQPVFVLWGDTGIGLQGVEEGARTGFVELVGAGEAVVTFDGVDVRGHGEEPGDGDGVVGDGCFWRERWGHLFFLCSVSNHFKLLQKETNTVPMKWHRPEEYLEVMIETSGALASIQAFEVDAPWIFS